MGALREGVVEELVPSSPDLIRLRVKVSGSIVDAVAFPGMIVPPRPGDRVAINTTGIDLDLGTGGVAFVLWNLDGGGEVEPGEGHIVKLRYTPWQTEVVAAEAPEGPHHDVLRSASSLEGMPVVACGLHSQVAGVVAGLRAAAPEARLGYLMTDGGALPLAWSNLIRGLRETGLIDVTATSGHAFGGDLECVNVLSGLLALRHGEQTDAVVVALGPGVVGTGTRFGHTSLEQGQILDAASALHGTGVGSLRISFADERERHQGVSHHSLTALGTVARDRAIVAVPSLDDAQMDVVLRQLDGGGIASKHELRLASGAAGLRMLQDRGLEPSTMGRPFRDVPELFAAGAAAGAIAAACLGREGAP